jgi:hypothetical protein
MPVLTALGPGDLTTDWAVAFRHFTVYMASLLPGEAAVAVSTVCQFASAVHPSTDATTIIAESASGVKAGRAADSNSSD